MSERFPDKVLREAIEAYESHEDYRAVEAMRAVLEGHLAAQEQPLAKVVDWPMTLECHCCGDTAATCDSDGMFYDGQPLECGCLGHVSADEEEAHVYILDGPCPPNAKCHKPSTGAASDGSPR